VVFLAFGNDPEMDKSTILLFGAALFLNIVKVVDDIFIMAKGAFEIGFWIPALEVPVYVVTGVLLSQRMGFAGILIASIATNFIVSIGLKGIVLSRQVFDSTKTQWYGYRLLSMGLALLAIIPLVFVYQLANQFVHPNILRFGATTAIALGYMLAGVRWLLRRSSRESRHSSVG
jgi:hypothetical protein